MQGYSHTLDAYVTIGCCARFVRTFAWTFLMVNSKYEGLSRVHLIAMTAGFYQGSATSCMPYFAFSLRICHMCFARANTGSPNNIARGYAEGQV